MWPFLGTLLVFSAALLTIAGGVTEEVRKLAAANTDFGLNLLDQIQASTDGGNVFMSPFSVTAALGMTYLGADGETAEQMAAGLRFGTVHDPIPKFKLLSQHLFNSNRGYALQQANRIYAERTFPVKESFKRDVKAFGASIQQKDFSDEFTWQDINLWVEEMTNRKIVDLVQKKDLESAVMVIINTIYFKATWDKPFPPFQTEKQDFNISQTRKVEVEMMRQTGSFNIGRISSVPAQILALPYTGKEVSMFVFLPDQLDGLCDVEMNLNGAVLEEAIQQMAPATVDVSLPKFLLEQRFDLKEALRGVGMKDMFNVTEADFSRLADNASSYGVAVSDVIHQSFVKVDENGTEAAGATSVIISVTSIQITEYTYVVNQPFLFLLRDSATQTVLFLGRVVDPTGKIDDLGSDGYKCKSVQRLAAVVGDNSTPSAGAVTLSHVGGVLLGTLLLLFGVAMTTMD